MGQPYNPVTVTSLPAELPGFGRYVRFLRRAGTAFVVGAVIVGGVVAGVQSGALPGGGGGFEGTCTTDNYWDAEANDMAWHPDECDFGTTLTQTNTTWNCNAPVETFGTPPIRIQNNWTVPSQSLGIINGVTFSSGCEGDGTSAVDFIVYVTPTDPTGYVSDPMKMLGTPGPSDLQITGVINCSAPGVTEPLTEDDHQDGMQFQGSGEMTLVNTYIGGDFDSGVSNCQGAGGTIFYSTGGGSGAHTTHVLGGEYVACHVANGIDAGGDPQPGSEVTNSKFRSGWDQGYCANFNHGAPCAGGADADVVFTNTICQRWNGSTWIDDPPP